MKQILIEENKLINDIAEHITVKAVSRVIAIIQGQPTVDAEPVRHGKWIMKSDPFGFFDEIPVCSECGCTTKMREKTKFCPNCGAKMDLEEENEQKTSD